MPARWSFLFAVLATAVACDAVLGCTPAPAGYILRADSDWLVGLFSGLSVSQATPGTVYDRCSSDPRCLAYNARGNLLMGRPGSRITILSGFRGYCTYVKDPNYKPAPAATVCAPAKTGYTLRADTNWVKGSGTTESQTTPGAAEQKCTADPECVAWNSFGYVISGKRDSVSYIPYKTLCVYVKDPPPACAPAKKGYTLKADTNWVKGSGTTESQTTPGAAEQKCTADPECVAWNSFGYVISGKRDSVSYIPYKTLCVYVKDPPPACPAKAGYVALADTNWEGSNIKESQTTPDNASKICDLDPNCVAWNSFGYYVLGRPSDIKLKPYKGLCVYTKKGLTVTEGRR